MRALPSLNGVKAFEAAARRGGFAGAAEELNVTPAAISRLVRLLEARLAVPLFERRANGLRLTPAGIAYRDGLTPILDSLATLTAQVCDAGRGRVLTLGVGPTFAIRWLIPRLAAFHAEAPDVEVRITTGGATVPFSEDWTCGIRLGDGDWPGFVAEKLFAADLSPVCAPHAAARLRKPEDLRRATLLRVAHARDDWRSWLKAAGVAELRVDGPVFEYYGHALQAAADGLGVAMGIRPYIDDDLAAGRLVAPFALTLPKGTSWYLVYRPHRAVEEGFRAFRGWITAAAVRPARPRARRAKS
ncbi:MAG: LysR substrate-binding domain-containing protein [Reyranellaceae bacterium]